MRIRKEGKEGSECYIREETRIIKEGKSTWRKMPRTEGVTSPSEVQRLTPKLAGKKGLCHRQYRRQLLSRNLRPPSYPPYEFSSNRSSARRKTAPCGFHVITNNFRVGCRKGGVGTGEGRGGEGRGHSRTRREYLATRFGKIGSITKGPSSGVR